MDVRTAVRPNPKNQTTHRTRIQIRLIHEARYGFLGAGPPTTLERNSEAILAQEQDLAPLLCVLVAMLPQPVSVVRPVPDVPSGHTKRARRNELPQTFFILADGEVKKKLVLGIMTVVACGPYVETAVSSPQFLRHVQGGKSVNHADYCLWTVGDIHSFINGPLELDSRELKAASSPIAERFVGTSLAKVRALQVKVGNWE